MFRDVDALYLLPLYMYPLKNTYTHSITPFILLTRSVWSLVKFISDLKLTFQGRFHRQIIFIIQIPYCVLTDILFEVHAEHDFVELKSHL